MVGGCVASICREVKKVKKVMKSGASKISTIGQAKSRRWLWWVRGCHLPISASASLLLPVYVRS